MEGEVIEFLTNTSAVTEGLPSFLADPINMLALGLKFVVVGIGLYALYLFIMLLINIGRNRRLKRVERKLDAIIKKFKINVDKKGRPIIKEKAKDKKKTKKK